MPDVSQVQDVLQKARKLTEAHWGTTNLDVRVCDASAWMCASVAIGTVVDADYMGDLSIEAHAAFLKAAGQDIPDSAAAILEAVYSFNDAQTDSSPVLDAFDRAITSIDPTPNADSALAVLAALDQAGHAVAHQIVSERSDLDEVAIASLASSELFYAAQDTAQACLLSEVER